MPFVKVEIQKGKKDAYKEEILSIVKNSLINSVGVKETSIFQRLYEIDKFDGCGNNDDFTMIEIAMLPGRSSEKKKTLIEELSNNLFQTLNIPYKNIVIIIQDPALCNWGMDGKQKGE